MINTGAGAGIYWDVGSSATLDTTTSFEGNILALASITFDDGATIGCGRALAETGAVTMDNNTINSTDRIGTVGAGSSGFSGGVDVEGTKVTFLPSAPVPEPASLARSSINREPIIREINHHPQSGQFPIAHLDYTRHRTSP